MNKNINVSFISTYIPRKCGIATFTNNLARHVLSNMDEGSQQLDGKFVNIAALNNTPEGYRYGPEVKFEIRDQNLSDYREAAYFLNHSLAEVINIQHEFGIYGGENGSNVITLIQNLKKPVVTTFHTVLNEPNEEQLGIVREISNRSSYIIVLSKRAIRILDRVYKIPTGKIQYIPHGAPDVPFLDPAYYKDKFQLSDRKVILTFGLIGPGKGIEDVISALEDAVKKFPKTTYVILGATHPNVLRSSGEEYRVILENLVRSSNLEDNVLFINRFVDNNELHEFLLMSDIYVCANQNIDQIVSGTLTYAMACGKAVISTPFWHAEEVLDNGSGILVPFRDPGAISSALKQLLGDEAKRNKLRKNAYETGRHTIWSKVASSYLTVFFKSIYEYSEQPRAATAAGKSANFPALPEVNLSHLLHLTDSTGILQHSTYSIANRSEGYCLDDNARALLLSAMNNYLYGEYQGVNNVDIYLAYVLHAFNPETGLFRNMMSYKREWLEDFGSEDSNAQTLFALGYLVKNPVLDTHLSIAKELFDKVIDNTLRFTSPRAWANIIIGCVLYLSKFSGATAVRKICHALLGRLSRIYMKNSSANWKWFEKVATYNNGRLPQAMLMGGALFRNKRVIEVGLQSLEWLYNVQYEKDKKLISLIGNHGWLAKGKPKAKYDQQPIEIPALIDACYHAYISSGDKQWLKRAGICFSWFLGNNDRQEMLYDYTTGGCFDGLSSSVVNQNQGAESTLSWLISLHRMQQIENDFLTK